MSSDKQQFEQGWQPPVGFQNVPGLQQKLPQEPFDAHLPTEDGGFQLYKAAGKLQGKKAVITGGDSGIGRATAILFAMEGAESLIANLPEEEDDALDTKKAVEKYGGKLHLLQVNLKEKENCKKVISEAVEKMGLSTFCSTTTRIRRSFTASRSSQRSSGSTPSTRTSIPSSTSRNTPSLT